MESRSPHRSSSLDQSRLSEATGHSSDKPSLSACDRNLIGMGLNPRQRLEQASTGSTSDSDQGK